MQVVRGGYVHTEPMIPTRATCARAPQLTVRGAELVAVVIAALLLSGGCRSTGMLDEMMAVSPYPDRDILATVATNDARPLALSEAVAYALASSPRISALRAAVHREAGNAAEAATPRSPEFRFGFGHEDEDARGWARETETGSSRRTGVETVRRSDYTSSSHTADVGDQSEDSLRLGLRYFPPNPWLLAAAGGAAHAMRWMAQAKLVEEEHDIICDTVEAAVQIAYGERALRLHEAFSAECRALYEELQRAAEAGDLPRTDLVDARVRLASADAAREREAARLASWRQKFRMSAGVDPDRVVLRSVEAGAICPVTLTNGAPQVSALARTLARQRPDVLAAHWNRLRYQQEWREARAAGYPWLNHVEGAYTRWDTSDHRERTVEKSSRETDVTSELGSITETEHESGTDYSTESSFGSADVDEWWLGVSVDLPIFEWFSRQSGERHSALAEAQRGYEVGRARAEREIVMASQVLQKSRTELDTLHRSFERDRREIEQLAEISAAEGLAGRLDALRLRERSTEIAILSLDRATAVALDELQFCRASGLAPGQPPPPTLASGPPGTKNASADR